jgi:CheY-like chemotaxis protein
VLPSLTNLFGFLKEKDNSASKYSILIVEDSEIDFKIVQGILTKKGYKVSHATNGEEGLAAVKTHIPDLILLDCEMPVMDGLEMCRRLKADPHYNGVPVIFLTGVNTPQNVIECFEMDAENYLSKPVSAKTLLSHVASAIEEYKASSA